MRSAPRFATNSMPRAGAQSRLTCGPTSALERLTERLMKRRPKASAADWLRRSVGLDPVAIGLLRESQGGPLPSDPATIAALIKAVPVVVTGTQPIARAISTAGGIAWSEVDETLMLRRMPGTFVAGEMLDWEAPTGGYLLQASFSTGVVAAQGALAWLANGGKPGLSVGPLERRYT